MASVKLPSLALTPMMHAMHSPAIETNDLTMEPLHRLQIASAVLEAGFLHQTRVNLNSDMAGLYAYPVYVIAKLSQFWLVS
jgi:hypothetical protein